MNEFSDKSAARWIFVPRPRSRPVLRLYCFPHAGAAAHTYSRWPNDLPESIELRAVQLPGRGQRCREAPIERLEPLLEALLTALRGEWEEAPFALYGHSLGGLVAFELARRLRSNGGPRPVALSISGRPAPHTPRQDRLDAEADEDYWKLLRRFAGTPDVLLNDYETMEFFLPILKADLQIVRDYICRPDRPLDLPLYIYVGRDDPETPPEAVKDWKNETSAVCLVREFAGGHFFNYERQKSFLSTLSADLQQILMMLHFHGLQRPWT
jgi:medium-chain acyl-[acyl-carrier-protein] hydrolase